MEIFCENSAAAPPPPLGRYWTAGEVAAAPDDAKQIITVLEKVISTSREAFYPSFGCEIKRQCRELLFCRAEISGVFHKLRERDEEHVLLEHFTL